MPGVHALDMQLLHRTKIHHESDHVSPVAVVFRRLTMHLLWLLCMVFRRLTISCGCGVQEAHHLLWLWCSGGSPSPVVVVFRKPTVSCGCGVQEAHRLLWLTHARRIPPTASHHG